MHQTGFLIHEINGDRTAYQFLRRDIELLETLLFQLLQKTRRHLRAGLGEHVATFGIHQIAGQFLTAQPVRTESLTPALAGLGKVDLVVEERQNFFLGQAEG